MNLLRSLFVLLILAAAAGAQSYQTFEIRTSSPMAGRAVNVTDPNGSASSIGTFSLSQAGSWSGNTWIGETCAVLGGVSFYLDENSPEQLWTLEAGGRVAQVTFAELQAAVQGGNWGGNGYVLPVEFASGSGIPSVEFLVGPFTDWDSGGITYSQNMHSLALVQPGGPGQPSVLTALSVGESFAGYTIEGESFTWSYAAATYDPEKAFYVADLTAGKRSPDDTTHLGLATWSDDPGTVYPLESITFYIDALLWGYTFTLHYQSPGRPEMVQSLTAWPSGVTGQQFIGYWQNQPWPNMGAWQSIDVTNLVSVTGSVALGSDYWLTWDAEPYPQYLIPARAHLTPLATNEPRQWSMQGMFSWGASGPTLETKEFYVPSGVSGGYVHQPTADRPLSEVVRNEVWEDYDAFGNPHHFYYDVRTADVDPLQPRWLEINGTEVSMNEEWYFNGWSPLNGPSEPPPPLVSGMFSLTLSTERANHTISLAVPGSNVGQLNFSGSSSISVIDPWHGTSWERSLITWQAPYSAQAGTWSLIDQSTNETQDFFLGGGDYTLDLRNWWLPSESLPLQISLSRWGHDLRLRQRNGEEFSVTPGASQGEFIMFNGEGWYDSYYYFDAAASRRSELEFWIYDATTDEEAPWNQTDLILWIAADSPQNLAVASAGAGSVDLYWPLGNASTDGGFQVERRLDGQTTWTVIGTVSADVPLAVEGPTYLFFTDSHPVLGTVHWYRVRYFYGPKRSGPSNIVQVDGFLDSDNDGLPDGWEISLFGSVDAISGYDDSDGDGVDNRTEWATNPSFVFDFFNGVTPGLTIVSGDGQEGYPGSLLPEPLTIRVTDALGNALVNAPVSFGGYPGTVLRSPNLNDPLPDVVRTDGQGAARAWLVLPPLVNYAVETTVVAAMESAQVTFHSRTQLLDPPVAPTDLRRTVDAQGRDVLTWTDTSDVEDRILIERQRPDGTWEVVAELPPNTTTYTAPLP